MAQRSLVTCVAVDFGGVLTRPEKHGENGSTPVDRRAANAIRRLYARGLRLVLASNTTIHNQQQRRPALAAAGIADCFAAVLLSTEIACAKPDPRFYAAILRAAACHVGDVLVVDDRTTYVRAATDFGMRAVLVDQRGTERTPPPAVPTLRHLAELPDRLETPR